ncbi:Splicing factor U2af large subunit B [Zostera marina]|uniref:Splicing factor U2af large subunit n=1 Tax=Zostera marina TaxID=29655 RepID=A0A0K9NZ62_ZOSMR|nr:Splicing factor U2af large subunit B [Zostera marina]
MSDRRSHHEGDDSKGHGHRIGHDAEENRESHRQKNSSRLEQGKSRTREEEHDRGSTDRDYRHREHHKDRSTRDERGADRLNDRNHRRSSRDERNRDHGRESDKRHRQSSYSHSREKSRNRSGSHSRSRSPAKSKRASGFDMAPPGVSATPIISPGQLPTVSQPVAGMFPNMFPFAAPNATRHARRVYVGGLPPMANEQTIATFFSQVMSAIGGNTSGPGDAVVNVYINHEKKFAFVEMRTVEEASNAMSLDGITFEGVAVRVRRPTDYNPSLAASLGPSQPNPHLNLSAIGLTPGILGGAEGPDRIFVGGLPYYFTETQIRELLESFGTLRGFDLVKDRDTGNSKGYGFCVYQDSAVTDIACAALNGLKMGDKTLTVRRATVSGQVKPEQEMILQQAQQHIAIQKIVLQSSGATLPGLGLITNASSPVPTKVICLTEVISVEDLRDDEEYTEILEDMREESGKFGSLVNVVIPRPSSTGDVVSGVGKVFLEYNDTSGSARAKAALHGRKFGGNTVTAFYYPEDKFSSGDYNYITAEN